MKRPINESFVYVQKYVLVNDLCLDTFLKVHLYTVFVFKKNKKK